MEDKILELCKKVIDGEAPSNNCTKIGCPECLFGDEKIDCSINSTEIKEIAQNYINGHEKTVNTIEKIEEKITLKELQEIKKYNIIPTYYHQGDYDVIQFCNDNDIDFVTGNIIKYITRYKYKNGIEDLRKAQEYLKRLKSKWVECKISLADLIHFNTENGLDYTQGKIIELVISKKYILAKNVLNDLIEKEEKKIKEIEETYQAEGMAD